MTTLTDTAPTTFTTNADHLLCDRYLAKGRGDYCAKCNNTHETTSDFLDRISLGSAEYRDYLLAPLYFLPNSPTLFNVGLPGAGTLSACFKFDVEDTLLDGPNSIMGTATKAAGVTKFGGGVGYYFGALRPKGATVNSTHGKAMGPVEVLRHYQSVGRLITQAGKREAAQMGILDVRHPDINEFIHVKDDNPQALNTFNISVALDDDFMRKALDDEKSAEALLLWDIAASAWKTGDPGVFFSDVAERGNPTPWLGRLTGTNPCGEVPLLNNEPCNLGSINLARFASVDGFDYYKLGLVVKLAINYLDDIVSLNTFPDADIQDANLLTRKLGLGVCGWADSLALMGIHYDTDEAVALAGEVMEFINDEARQASREIAAEYESAPAYAVHGGGMEPYRNATRTCIAPTGSIAILMGASSGIEPHFSLSWDRTMGTGAVLKEYAPHREGFTPKVSHDIAPEWHIAHQAAFQEHTDLAVSKTINLPNEATVQDVYDAYKLMWTLNCKGGTVYRDGSRDVQVLNVTPSLADFDKCESCGAGVIHAEGCVECENRCGWSACAT